MLENKLSKSSTLIRSKFHLNLALLMEVKCQFFDCLQGSVAFSEETGDRIAWTKIEQLQNKKYEVVAFYDQKSDNLTW